MKKSKILLPLIVALELLASLAFADENSVEAARAAIEEQRFEDAKEIASSLIEADAESSIAHFLLGKANGGLQDFESAVENYKTAIELDDTVAEYFAEYGSALVNRGQQMNMFQAGPTFMKALDQYKTAVKLDPDNLHSHIGLCRYYWNAPAIAGGSMKKAKDHAAEVARINPYLGHIEHALIAKKENRTEDAISEFQAVIDANPNEAWVHFELGELYKATEQTPKAKAAYEKTLELAPEHEGAKAALAALEDA